MLLIISNIHAQEFKGGILQGSIRVKFKPEVVSGIKELTITKTKGVAYTGIASIDELNADYSVQSMKRVFPYSLKHEAKHQKHGLHLWYEVELGASVVKSMASVDKNPAISIAKAYDALDDVTVAEPIREIHLVEPYSAVSAKITNHSVENYTSSLSEFNDPLLHKQWHYNNIGQTGGTEGEDIRLFDAWKIETGDPRVIVSIHDEGIDVNHEDLRDAMWVNEAELNGEDGVDDDNNGFIDDINGYNFSDDRGKITPGFHGTHVAGTVGAINNNNRGVSGVAGGSGENDGVRLMSCMIIGGESVNLIPNSFVYAADNGAVISQNSWGYDTPDMYEEAIHDAIDYFIYEAGDYEGSPMKGGIVLFAAGNVNSEGLFYPAAYEPCIAVAASDAFGNKASFSNYGTYIDIIAPGGDEEDNVPEDTLASSILSCFPYNDYGYMEGTSQSCPHVSGIAALVVSKYGDEDFSAKTLEKHIITGVRKFIYELPENEQYKGKLGSGAANAALALDYDYGIPPNAVSDLEVISTTQDVVKLQWTVPEDSDDRQPERYKIIYGDEEINDNNITDQRSVSFYSTQEAGSSITFDVSNLASTTLYYFVVQSFDRWEHASAISNQVSTSTTAGPMAQLDSTKTGFEFNIDVSTDSIAMDSVLLFNRGEGVLRWDANLRHIEATPLSVKPAGLSYPEISSQAASPLGLKAYAYSPEVQLSSIQDENREEYTYIMRGNYRLRVIGETDFSLPNSSATKFRVHDPEGFNLTHVEVLLNHDPENGNAIVEIYQGEDIETADLLLAQETEGEYYIFTELDYHLYFEEGSTFWLVYHIPPGNEYPLVAGVEAEQEYSQNCYYSYNLGKTWSMNEEVGIDKQFVWKVYAMSRYHNIDEYVKLSPESGEVNAGDSIMIYGKVNGSTLINGSYQGLITININEKENPLLDFPVDLTVSGQIPALKSANRVDYSSVMLGAEKTMAVEMRNESLARFEIESIQIDNPQFTMVSEYREIIEAGTSQILRFKYRPTSLGNSIANITLTESNHGDHKFQLFGVGIDPPVAELIPAADTFNLENGYALSIGDTIEGNFVLSNSGNYPLDYFMPAFSDGSNMASVPGDIHKFGYIARVDSMGISPAFVWEDISETGVNVTSELIGGFDKTYYETEIGFEFPFFGKNESNVFISRYTLLSFDTEGIIWQQIPMFYKYHNSPDRFISAVGTRTWYDVAGFGDVYYQRFPDRFIVQYDSIPYEEDLFGGEHFTIQIVLHDNGNINIYYKDVQINEEAWWGINPLDMYTLVAIEDQTQDDGILIHDQKHNGFTFRPGSAIEFINPGFGLFTDLSSTEGTIMPHESVTIDYKIPTDSLYVAEYSETLPIITNDPVNNPLLYRSAFELISGGSAEIAISDSAIDFGDVFQYDSVSFELIISNSGKATDSILTADFDNATCQIFGNNIPEVLKPGRKLVYQLVPDAGSIGSLSDTLRFLSKNGELIKLPIRAEIIAGPEVSVNPEYVIAAVESGEQTSTQITVTNIGSNILTVVPLMNDWISVYEAEEGAEVDTLDIDYYWESSEEGKTSYEYHEIIEDAVMLEGLNGFHGGQWSEAIELPFTFNYYGVDYDSLYIGYNGLVTFTPDQDDHDYIFDVKQIPHLDIPQNFIAPLWVMGGTSNPQYFPETGQYYLLENERVIVEFRDYNTGFAMGDPISYQVILYPDGKIKFQYKMPEHTKNYVTGMGLIGIENYDGTNGVMISHMNQTVNSNMSIIFHPYQLTEVLSGESRILNVGLSAIELYAGSYVDSLRFITNDPLNKLFEIYTRLLVTGEAEIVIPDSVEFGDLMVVIVDEEDPEAPVYLEYIREFEISNPGTDRLLISEFLQNKPAENIIEAYIYTQLGPDFYDWRWKKLFPEDIFEEEVAPLYLEPGTSLKMRVRIQPEEALDLNDVLTVKTDLGNFLIDIKAQSYLPSSIEIDNTPIDIYAQTENHQENRSVSIQNAGGYPLIYELSIEFERQDVLTHENTISTSSKVQPGSAELQQAEMIKLHSTSDTDKYNRILANDTASYPEGVLGYGSNAFAFHTATRFTAPEDGFNLTHVQTWFVPATVLTSEILVQVYGGSDDIYSCELLYEGTYTHSIVETDSSGELLTIPLDEGHLIFPEESFFVVFGYPIEVGYPQGYVTGQPIVRGNTLFGPGDGNWYDIVGSGFDDTGWFVRAVEETYVRSVWAEVLTDLKDTIGPGSSETIELDFDAVFASPGVNEATLKISSNDPYNQNETVSMKLYRNQGPQFSISQDIYRVLEMDTIEIVVEVEDVEGDSYTFSLSDDQGFATAISTEYSMIITCTPGFEDQGMRYLIVAGEDEHTNVSERTIEIEVININRKPVANDIGTVVLYTYKDDYQLLTGDMLFSDPDGDELSISVEESQSGIVNIFESADQFLLDDIDLGTTYLNFTAIDEYGAEAENSVEVIATDELSNRADLTGDIELYPNPCNGVTNLRINNDLFGDAVLKVVNLLGQHVYIQNYPGLLSGSTIEIDLSGLPSGMYTVELESSGQNFIGKLIIN